MKTAAYAFGSGPNFTSAVLNTVDLRTDFLFPDGFRLVSVFASGFVLDGAINQNRVAYHGVELEFLNGADTVSPFEPLEIIASGGTAFTTKKLFFDANSQKLELCYNALQPTRIFVTVNWRLPWDNGAVPALGYSGLCYLYLNFE